MTKFHFCDQVCNQVLSKKVSVQVAEQVVVMEFGHKSSRYCGTLIVRLKISVHQTPNELHNTNFTNKR